MPAFDWPLTVFTLTTQLVLGAFAVLWVTDLLARQLADTREQEYLTSIGVWLLGPLMAAGFAVSMLHLGQPLHAYRALSNVANSWLSREILFLNVFFVLGAGYAALWWKRREQFTLRASVGAVVGVAGGLGLLAMTALYLLPAMPTWSQVSTPLSFVATALTLGPLLVAAVFLTTYRRFGHRDRLEPLLAMHLRYMAVTVLIGAGLAATSLGLKLTRLSALGLEGQASLTLLTVNHRLLLWGRTALLLVGVLLVVVLLARVVRGRAVGSATALTWALLGVFVMSETLGRLLFYATAVPLRPPGTFW